MTDQILPATKYTQVTEEQMTMKDPPRLVWIPVREAVNLLWNENPKLHDLGAIGQSIGKYGFQELPRFDINLINLLGGKGAIKAGNGRIEALAQMEKAGESLPRGLAHDHEGRWVMPLLIGTDAETLAQAVAYAVDSNNLTLSGGDFTAFDMKRLWDSDAYLKVLTSLGQDEELPVTVSGDDLDLFTRGLQIKIPEVEGEERKMGVIYGFRIEVGNGLLLEDAIKATREFLDDHPEWECTIVVS